MAKRTSKKSPARGEKKAAPVESKKSYLAKRLARVRELYMHEGLEPVDIAERLVDEGAIKTSSDTLDSAVRLVRADVALIRKGVDAQRKTDAPLVSRDLDVLERELLRLRRELRRQEIIAAGEPGPDGKDATITTSTITPEGVIVMTRPKWPAGVRQKASRDASRLATEISKIEMVLSEKRSVEAEGSAEKDAMAGGLTIIESDKSIEELIKQNGVN
jgi:hypothetical protein